MDDVDDRLLRIPQPIELIDPGQWQGKDPPPREWAWEHWMPARQATYLTGPGSAGKSLLAQHLCTCSGIGVPCLGVPTRKAVALYITCEDDPDELHRRQAAICALLDIGLSDLTGRLHLVSRVGCLANELANFSDGMLKTTALWDELVAKTEETAAELIVLDNVAHFFAGNENARNEVAPFVNLTNRLALHRGAAVLLLGHPSKGHDFSGSTAWSNQFRARLYLDRVKGELDTDLRELTTQKANYSAGDTKLRFRWHRGAFIREEDLPAGYRDELAATVRASKDNDIFLRCLDIRNGQDRPVSDSKASRTYAPKEFADMSESGGIGKDRLESAMDRLFRIDEIKVGVVCRTGRKDRHGLCRKVR